MKLCTMNKERIKVIASYSLFLVVYVVLFAALEQREVPLSLVMSRFDKLIPFCEYFIIPYLFWFLYLIVMALYFAMFCEDLREVKRVSGSFMVGMSVFLAISFLFPNGHTLRPILSGDSFFVALVKGLYAIDTSTNVFPSMHVFCTIAATIALARQEKLTKMKGFMFSINVIAILIVLSTVFLKQHSVIDVIGALVLNFICYLLFYKRELTVYRRKSRMIHQL